MTRWRAQWRAAISLVVGSVVVSLLLGCHDEELHYARPPFVVVDGTPTVGVGGSAVDHREPREDPRSFTYSASVRVDVFRQEVVRKVDILWMVDNSPSMTAVQENLRANFGAFMRDLVNAEPPVDYHLGVLTSNTLAEKGALRQIEGYPSLRYIACNAPELNSVCNVGSLLQAQEAFQQTVMVGAAGEPVERGLLSVQLALSEPMLSTVNSGFLREDATLYVILVSDEDDASCTPILSRPASGDHRECGNYPSCRCADDEDLDFGSVDYFVRFFRGLKGFGEAGRVKVTAIVGDDSQTLNLCIEGEGCTDYLGCRNPNLGDGVFALNARRYASVARETGGFVSSICEEDYASGLSEIGFAASGQRREFQLSRPPVDPVIEPFRVVVVTEEAGRRVRAEVPHVSQSANGGWSYARCEDGAPVNLLRFHGAWIPEPQALVEVAYHVDSTAVIDCSPTDP